MKWTDWASPLVSSIYSVSNRSVLISRLKRRNPHHSGGLFVLNLVDIVEKKSRLNFIFSTERKNIDVFQMAPYYLPMLCTTLDQRPMGSITPPQGDLVKTTALILGSCLGCIQYGTVTVALPYILSLVLHPLYKKTPLFFVFNLLFCL